MFYVQNSDHVDCFKSEDFETSKKVALQMKDELAENFSISEVKQVWTTQTLDEVIKCDGDIDSTNYHYDK